MRGNQRTSGELSRREGGKIFGSGSRTPIAITLLVKKQDKKEKASIWYHDIGDYLSREEKLQKVKSFGSVLNTQMELSSIKPNEAGDWLNQRDGLFETFIALGDKENKNDKTIFMPCYSCGVKTNRDSWVYNFSESVLTQNISSMIDIYNAHISRFQEGSSTEFNYDSTKISWSDTLKQRALKQLPLLFDKNLITTAMYRPFCKHHFYYGKAVLERTYQLPKIFPHPQTKNLMICVPGIGAKKGFSALMVDCIPDVQMQYNGQCFPLHYYIPVEREQLGLFDTAEGDWIQRDGISDFILQRARELYGPKCTKDEVFFYIYGLLHSPDYKKRFESDLTKMLPRIPFVEDTKKFKAFSSVGYKLAQLHIHYEAAQPWDDAIIDSKGPLYVDKMRFGKNNGEEDRRTIILDARNQVENIPLQAYEYVINGKSPLEWLMERYSYTVHSDSKIVNDPNAWGEEHNNSQYILNLLLSLITVSMETLRLVATLPSLSFPDGSLR